MNLPYQDCYKDSAGAKYFSIKYFFLSLFPISLAMLKVQLLVHGPTSTTVSFGSALMDSMWLKARAFRSSCSCPTATNAYLGTALEELIRLKVQAIRSSVLASSTVYYCTVYRCTSWYSSLAGL